MKKVVSIPMLLLFVNMPLLVIAQQSPIVLDARLAAERDAKADVNQLNWRLFGFGMAFIGGGCLLGTLSVASAYTHQSTPPQERFLGKSPEYILAYTDAYESKARRLQVESAAIGCIAGSVTAASLVIWYLNLQNY